VKKELTVVGCQLSAKTGQTMNARGIRILYTAAAYSSDGRDRPFARKMRGGLGGLGGLAKSLGKYAGCETATTPPSGGLVREKNRFAK
jgi:hypothetical protein